MTVIGHLHVLQALARLLPDFWIGDAELMAIALLSDNSAPPKGGKRRSWGATKVGQCVLALQIIEDMRKRHKAKAERVKKDKGISESARQPEHAYLLNLEDRITVLLDAREKVTLLPFSQRLLIVTLLHEIRSYTLWPARLSWLARIMNWTLQAQPLDPTRLTAESSDVVATEDVRDELGATISRLRGVYMACSDVQVSNAKQSRSTLLFSPTSLEPIDQLSGMGAAADDNMSVFTALPEKLEIACARFLVLISQCLSQFDRHRLGPTVWRMLDSTEAALLKPACFLSMYLSEKDDTFAGMVRDDLQSNYGSTRRQAVHRLSSLFAWRFQVLSQRFIHKAERDNPGYRPLRSGRPALQFVPVDVGSSQFVLEQNEAELKARFGEALPRDVIRRLLEIDWVQENKPPDKRLEIIRTPFSVLPSMQLDRGLDDVPEMVMSQSTSGNLAPSPTGTPSPGLSAPTILRRKSSASSATFQVVKRRPVFTPSLLRALPSLALSVTDPDVAISSAARDLLVDFMREDAATLCRPLIDSISGDMEAVGDLRAFLHVQQILPPIMSHFVFGHLAGFIRTHSKAIERTVDSVTGVATERIPNFMLHAYASTVPILYKLVSQVSNLGVQDLRRAKLELLRVPSGLL
ncbi:hypothetical protein EXIGLDRAFT_783962 [Exidia glandulosa HHB12029]|uniref:Uncharacterized protein n=1 Tax=Exidia glandulosa HHB12029 TaxID=1314781 RepID=A0A166MSH8_EXIGL|nr:hypothetical protein EXIGLDRAFT_783962 [Exidia glandulosa HHB12029]